MALRAEFTAVADFDVDLNVRSGLCASAGSSLALFTNNVGTNARGAITTLAPGNYCVVLNGANAQNVGRVDLSIKTCTAGTVACP